MTARQEVKFTFTFTDSNTARWQNSKFAAGIAVVLQTSRHLVRPAFNGAR